MVLPKVLEQETGENEAVTSAMHWLRRKERCLGTASATFLGGLGRRAVLFERQSRLPSVALQRMLAWLPALGYVALALCGGVEAREGKA